MSTLEHLRLFSHYNKLMNERIYSASTALTEKDLGDNRGAFFGSVLGTLNHILVGDIIWLKRFATHHSSKNALAYLSDIERPASLDTILYRDLPSLRAERETMDNLIIHWIDSLTETDIKECIAYQNMKGERFRKKYSSLISHLFLHQVHHRGQVTTLLSQSGIDFGETDLIEIMAECEA